MAKNLNRLTICGRLTKDPELKTTNGGTPIAGFSIAVNRQVKKGDKYEDVASFFECIAWGKYPGETIAKHFKKGQKIMLEGYIQQRSWEDKNGGGKRSKVEIVVEGFEFMEGKAQEGGGSSKSEPDDAPSARYSGGDDAPTGGKSHFDDSDIPF